MYYADPPATVIPHVHADPATSIGKLIDQRLLDVNLDAVSIKREAFEVVDGFADPTDRPFDLVSSPEDGAAGENAHDAAALGNKPNLLLG